MLINLEPELRDGKIPEWGLMEFQGNFSMSENCDGAIFDEFIGDLNYTKDGTPFFVNGHHIMYGQEVKLQRPFAILCKDFAKGDCVKQYVVKAVVRRKIIFKTRPKPIIPHEVPINNV